jgi:DNA replication protein DnaC
MEPNKLEKIEESLQFLKIGISQEELAQISKDNAFTIEQLEALDTVLAYAIDKKHAQTIHILLKLSRLPLKSPRTFSNFDFSILKGANIQSLKSLETLAPIYAKKNIAFIGPPGTGKTHLAQAFGYACCQNGMKTYFIKMSELRDRFNLARKTGTVSRLMNSLVRPSCLIIDEVGHCEFDVENTRLFFDLIDRRYNKDGSFNMIFTSNKMPSEWKENFCEESSLLCTLDRIFDNALVFTFKGESYRGKSLENVVLEATGYRTTK